MKARKRVVTSLPRGAAAWPVSPSKPRPPTPSVPPPPAPRQAPGGPRRAAGGALDRGSGPAARAVPVVSAAAEPEVDLAVELGRGLLLRNPLLAASGSMGYGIELEDAFEPERLGALCTRGTTLRARPGNPPARMASAPAGLVNAVGLHNPGLDAVLERYSEAWARWPLPVIVNLAAGSTGDFVELARRLEGVPGIAGIELNLSCPNAARGGTLFALDPDAAGSLVSAVRRASDLPLLAKLSPAAPDPRAVARAVVDSGADGISAVNTLPALALAADRSRPMLGVPWGGLSGPALRPVALRVVHEIAASVRVPIVAMGGVTALDDVLDFLAAGASAVAVGTAAIADPALPGRLADELAAECVVRGLASYRSLVGTALPGRAVAPSARGAEYRP